MGEAGNVRNTLSHTELVGHLEHLECGQKERKKTDNPGEGWENGTPPPHRDFKERGVVR